jgi:hypothetical protein
MKSFDLHAEFTFLNGILLLSLICVILCSCRTAGPDQSTVYLEGALRDSVDAMTRATPPGSWEEQKMACYNCHAAEIESYEQSKHFTRPVTCVLCHGSSPDHLSDPENPPEVTFQRPVEKEADFCQMYCHVQLPPVPHEEIEDCTGCHPAHTFALP